MTAFILNLAFADFFVCGFNIFQHVYQSSNQIICIIIDNLGYSNEYSEFMSLAMLAAFRCLSVIYPGKASILRNGTNRIIVFIAIRIYSLLLLIPYNFDVSYRIHDFYSSSLWYLLIWLSLCIAVDLLSRLIYFSRACLSHGMAKLMNLESIFNFQLFPLVSPLHNNFGMISILIFWEMKILATKIFFSVLSENSELLKTQ